MLSVKIPAPVHTGANHRLHPRLTIVISHSHNLYNMTRPCVGIVAGLSKKAAKPVTTVQDYLSTFETTGYF